MRRASTKLRSRELALVTYCLRVACPPIAPLSEADITLYAREDSNLHELAHRTLKPARLPIPPRARVAQHGCIET